MNRDVLEMRLERTFDGTPSERRVVVRQAGDLHDSERYAADHGTELTIDTVVSNLTDAPDEYDLVDRWNWWIGAMDLAHGGYESFLVRAYRD